jgi:hypothetical protein
MGAYRYSASRRLIAQPQPSTIAAAAAASSPVSGSSALAPVAAAEVKTAWSALIARLKSGSRML